MSSSILPFHSSWTVANAAGTFQPTATQYGGAPLPDGTQVAFARGISSLTQVVPLTLNPNHVYTLRVYVGWRADQGTFPNGAIRVYSSSTHTPLAVQPLSSANVVRGLFRDFALVFQPPLLAGMWENRGWRECGALGRPSFLPSLHSGRVADHYAGVYHGRRPDQL